MLETSDGQIWVATADGLARLDPESRAGASRFTTWRFGANPENIVRVLHEDSRGRLWVGSGPHLLRARREGETTRFERVAFELPFPGPLSAVNSLVEGPRGDFWIGSDQGLIRILADGSQALYPIANPESARAAPAEPVVALGFDRAGNLWLARNGLGVLVYRPEDVPTAGPAAPVPLRLRAARDPTSECRVRRQGEVCLFPAPDPLPTTWLPDFVAEGDAVWLATRAGLVRFDGEGFRVWDEAHGLDDPRFECLLRDTAGSLWLGTVSRGVLRLAADGMESLGEANGLRGIDVAQLLETSQGQVVAVTLDADGYWLNVLHQGRVESLRPHGLERGWGGWAFNQWVLQDSRGEWWIPHGGNGLYRYPAVQRVDALAQTPPLAHYTAADGLPSDQLWRLYEDRAGDLWVSAFSWSVPVAVWERATGRFRPLGPESGLPAAGLAGTPNAFVEDADGRLWIGFYPGGVARSTDASRRRFELFGEEDGVPATWVLDLFVDSAGRLWIAAGRAVLRVDDPAAAKPEFRRLTAEDGLSMEGACCFAEDAFGRIYVGSARGVDRLDLASGRSRHFTTADGLAGHLVRSMLTDRNGDLWIGTFDGLSHLRPRRDAPSRPPVVRIGAVEVAGQPWPVPELGATGLAGLTLAPGDSRLTVGFFGISLKPGEDLRYQYRLRGVSEEWSAPSPEPSVAFAEVPPGEFELEVRAVRADGTVSAVPATLSFRRLPPLWARAWFQALIVAVAAASAWEVLRRRARRRRMLAEERRRIARDLHDELGSGLARVSILLEVARRQIETDPREAARVLQRIGEGSRGMNDVAADLIWSLDSAGEDLAGLVTRLREFAGDVLSGAGVRWTLNVAPDAEAVQLGPRRQRQLFLILKEAIHNVVRHAGARRVEMGLVEEADELTAWVRDDGRGFEAPGPRREGTHLGLRSMERRARDLGGHLDVESAPGAGTTVRVRLPTARRRGRMRVRPRKAPASRRAHL